MHVLAIGECMAEFAPADMAGTYRLGFAGDTFNTAWYLARCASNIHVSYLTMVGEDPISTNLRAFMADSGIDDRFLRTHPDRTIGLYMISLQDGERNFTYWRGQSAARMLADDPEYLAQAIDAVDIVYFSGITLAILSEQARTTLLSALQNAREIGKCIVFDPNLRPVLWASADQMTDVIMKGAAISNIACPSFEDEATYFGDRTPHETAKRYLGAGVTTVVVKNGPGPVIYAEGQHFGQAAVRPLEAVTDTTAAGDSFDAGLLAAHVAGTSLTDAVAYACQVSRIVVQHKGALVDAPLPTLM